MEKKEILQYIDHTQLKAFASWKEIEQLCKEAIENQTASVCIPPSYVKEVKEHFGNALCICTVIGFPLGYHVTAVKAEETRIALEYGADEIDMVINIGDVKNGRFDRVKEEIALLKKITGEKILKVIVETCYLTEEEKIKLCEIVTEAGADYIKTSTGFGSGGATHEDVRLFREKIGPEVKIKAAGGIHSEEDMRQYLEEGCSRIGSSSAVSMLRN
ncbi:MAG: deoxyribose-phosphate aldolase [Lachnospiraceae bacterium]|jgi:deoxyribose-phosphate aldolase